MFNRTNSTDYASGNVSAYISGNVLGVILAGGLSSRMGQDKTLLARGASNNSLSMLDFSKQLLRDSGLNDIIISGDNHQVPDLVKGAGPVGGIYSIVQYCISQKKLPKAFLILPVDLPLMTASTLQQLRLKGELSQQATFFQEASGKAHNIPLYLPYNAYLELYLAQAFKGFVVKKGEKNGPSIRSLLKQMPNQSVTLPHTLIKNLTTNLTTKVNTDSVLFNSNTPKDWQRAKQSF